MEVKRPNLICLVVLLCLSMVACTKQVNLSEMSYKEKVVLFRQIYIDQYDDYQEITSRDDLTEAQKIILRNKRKVLVAMEAAINIYASVVEEGRLPIKEEQQILKLINQAIDLGGDL